MCIPTAICQLAPSFVVKVSRTYLLMGPQGVCKTFGLEMRLFKSLLMRVKYPVYGVDKQEQEFITIRVCNFHMVSTPTIWIGWRRQSAVNMLIRYLTWSHFRCYIVYISYVNTVAKAHLFTAVFSQLTIFTADCLHHPIQMAGIETIWELHTLIVINSWQEP